MAQILGFPGEKIQKHLISQAAAQPQKCECASCQNLYREVEAMGGAEVVTFGTLEDVFKFAIEGDLL